MSDASCDSALLQKLLSATAEYLRGREPLAEFVDAFGTTARAPAPQPKDAGWPTACEAVRSRS